MNRIPPLNLPNLTAQVLHEGVLIEAKKGAVLSDEDCGKLVLWLANATLKIELFVADVPTGTEHGFPLFEDLK